MLLSVRDLRVEFAAPGGVVRAVAGVGFDVAAGERVGLVGESGSGKTTTALALMRMIKPPGRISGSAVLSGTDLFALDARQVRTMRLRRVAYVPQGAMNSLNPVLRVREQILDGLADHGVAPAGGPTAFVARALAGVGLASGVAEMFPHELSGGMKQRACIAIAIALDPELIIADEPTSALDVISQRQVMRTLADVQARIGCGLVMIGHDMGLMAQVTDRIVVMRDGRIVEDAPTTRLFLAPAHAYSRTLIESVPSLGGRIATPPKAGTPPRGSSTPPPLLAFEGVGKTYGGTLRRPGKAALEPLDFALDADRPSIVSVVGQSGSGKTTMARLILGLETPSTGVVRYLGAPIGDLRGRRRVAFRREVQAIFQDPYASFNPFYRVDRTLVEPMRRLGAAPAGGERAALEAACTTVGLDPGRVLGRFPHELSGGQRQRLMVARALLLKPRLIVADEPVSMVDASLRLSILRSLAALRMEHGISIVYITHDLATAYQVSDQVLVLHDGRIVESGDPREVILKPAHPYTRALVAAIPWPDPARGWPDADAAMGQDWDAPPVLRGPAAALT